MMYVFKLMLYFSFLFQTIQCERFTLINFNNCHCSKFIEISGQNYLLSPKNLHVLSSKGLHQCQY